jgi:hypothetical protein
MLKALEGVMQRCEALENKHTIPTDSQSDSALKKAKAMTKKRVLMLSS